MMYLKKYKENNIEEEKIQYPYSLSELKNDNKNTSFTDVISLETLQEYGVFIVNPVNTDNDYTKIYTEDTPILVNGEYYQNWIVTNASEEQINFRISSKWEDIRVIRNQYLTQSDWAVLLDSPLNEIKKQEWIVYRQALRDITTQSDPFNITWPTKPE